MTTNNATVQATESVAPVSGTTNKGGVNNGYPFMSKAQIKARLEAEPAFQAECLLVIHARQTDDEQQSKDTKWSNARGFMSSHAKRGSALAQMILNGEDLTADDLADVARISGRYVKQLAEHFRSEAKQADPTLSEKSRVFGV